MIEKSALFFITHSLLLSILFSYIYIPQENSNTFLSLSFWLNQSLEKGAGA